MWMMEKNKGGRPPLYTKEQWAWIKKRRKEGYTLKEIAAFLGIDVNTVWRNIGHIDMRPKKPLELRKAEFNRLVGGRDD